MPASQPFTALCQALARGRRSGWYDLHLHTTHSDGRYSPPQVVDLARRCGLAGIAITDHDVLSALPDAVAAARGSAVEVISGVEITCQFQGRELHLLGYFVRPDDPELVAALARLQTRRQSRFAEMVERLKHCGIELEPETLPVGTATALGRRHLAEIMVRTRRVGSVREAFARYLGDNGRVAVAKASLPVAEAIGLVHGAGGVASWAHPSYDGLKERLAELRHVGLDAVEADYPGRRPSVVKNVRGLAETFGLAVTGGSDCHGPDQRNHEVGARGIDAEDFEELRGRIQRERRAESKLIKANGVERRLPP